MAAGISTIQSLKAVDAWIDVINANINGGVRTAFKTSRLKFAGSNTDVSRPGTATNLPLQFPEPSLVTANTIIDFSQGAVAASSETTHLAIQGPGFFVVASPETMNLNPVSGFYGRTLPTSNARFLLTRDGEFHTDKNGFMVTSYGYYLLYVDLNPAADGRFIIQHDATAPSPFLRAIYNDIDNPNMTAGAAFRLSRFLGVRGVIDPTNGSSLVDVQGKDMLQYSGFGSTVYDIGHRSATLNFNNTMNPGLNLRYVNADESQILSKSLEASNASMTQSVPELSLAQKLFSALTKVLQTKQTNVDGVLNLVR